MRAFYSLLIAFVILNSSLSEAQIDVLIKKKSFKTDELGFKDAWNHIKDGDSYFNTGGIWYNNAFDEYLKAIVYNSANAELNYKAGASALLSDSKEEASGFLMKALELNSSVAEDVMLLTGRALQYSGRYSEAIEKYNDYLLQEGKKPEGSVAAANRFIEECSAALIITKDTLRVEISNSGAGLNSNSDDFSPVFSSDGKMLYFASKRDLPGSGLTFPEKKSDEDIYFSQYINGTWDAARAIGKELTTDFSEAPLYLNSLNDLLYIYSGKDGSGDIKMSKYKKDGWRAPEDLPFNINTSGSETSFAIFPSGDEIYFVTDGRKDKIGGKDIYYISRITDRKWSKPVNAGTGVNSVYDEEAVCFSLSGDTMWFSSKGHNSIGGFDIFYSVRNQSGSWDKAINYGYPVNTPWNEMFYHPSPEDDSTFYFASDRSGGFGGLDIYRGRLLLPVIEEPEMPVIDTVIVRDTVVVIQEVAALQPAIVEKPVLYLAGRVHDAETGDPVMAKIDLIDPGTDIVVLTTASSDLDGSFRMRLPEKKSYMIDLRATGFLSELVRVNVPDTLGLDILKMDFSMVKVKVGKKVVMNNIFFETGKAVLTQSSYAEINRLLILMQDNPKMKIEISGHTDKTGSEPVNLKLSENRAKSVYEYLVEKGINGTRMEYTGFGSLQPVDDNSTAQGRANNRRVEFKILEL
jgi:outer membrane protein OmpA-like peptidoglycan-associated protein/tetratricopeptide (TPR) repeat protein